MSEYAGKYADNRKLGIGGAPTRCTTLPETPAERKQFPIASGVLDYFPDAIAAIAYLSYKGNEQHNPGQPLHWARGKSSDESDTMMRHFLQRGTLDTDGVRHSVKMAWRALAILQKEIESEQPEPDPVIERRLFEVTRGRRLFPLPSPTNGHPGDDLRRPTRLLTTITNSEGHVINRPPDSSEEKCG